MLYNLLWVLLGVWTLYVFILLLVMGLIKPNHPCYTGFRIVMPDHLLVQLTEREYCAVYLHESGHAFCAHVWLNFARVIFFLPISKQRLQCQELEADDFASEIGYGLDLASAITKLGAVSAFDVKRIERLRKVGGMPATQTLGMSAH